MSYFKFKGAGQRDTPVATLPDLIEIVTKLDCGVARELASISARLFVGHVGGDLRQALENLANHSGQKRLLEEDPESMVAQFGKHADDTGGNGVGDVSFSREKWNKWRNNSSVSYNKRRCVQLKLGSGVQGVNKTTNKVNGAILGFDEETTTTTEFIKSKKLSRPSPIDYFSEKELLLREMTESALTIQGKNQNDIDGFDSMADEFIGHIRAIVKATKPETVETPRVNLRNNHAWGAPVSKKNKALPQSPAEQLAIISAPRALRSGSAISLHVPNPVSKLVPPVKPAPTPKLVTLPAPLLLAPFPSPGIDAETDGNGASTRTSITFKKRMEICFEQHQLCGKCSTILNFNEFDIDHRIPLFLGGSNERKNLWAICLNCHRSKTTDENSLQPARVERRLRNMKL